MTTDELRTILGEPGLGDLVASLEAGTSTRLRIVDVQGRPLLAGGESGEWGGGDIVRLPIAGARGVEGSVEGWNPHKTPQQVERDAGILLRIVRRRLEEEQRHGELCEEIICGYSQLNIFYDLSRALGDTADVQGVCRVVLEQIAELAGARSGSVLLLDEHSGKLELAESMGAGPVAPGNPTDLLHKPAVRPGGLSVPIRVQTGPIGAVVLGDWSADHRPTARELKGITSVASYAGATLRHIQLFAQEKELFLGTIQTLVSTIETKDPYTLGHSERVAGLAVALGSELGYGRVDLERLRLAALLHDIGKIGIPETILLKEGKLTDDEFAVIKQHPETGGQILGHIGRMVEIGRIVRHHHERWDGRGYPDGLRGDAIPPDSRILAVADAADAMMSDRVYREGMSAEEMIRRLRAGAGTQFAPDMVRTFIEDIAPSTAFRAFELRLAVA